MGSIWDYKKRTCVPKRSRGWETLMAQITLRQLREISFSWTRVRGTEEQTALIDVKGRKYFREEESLGPQYHLVPVQSHKKDPCWIGSPVKTLSSQRWWLHENHLVSQGRWRKVLINLTLSFWSAERTSTQISQGNRGMVLHGSPLYESHGPHSYSCFVEIHLSVFQAFQNRYPIYQSIVWVDVNACP